MDVTLREYFEKRLDDLEKRVVERFASSESAVTKAERTMNERLNSMNEFRDALKDQANRMATRVELDKIDEAVQELQRAKANLDGRLLVLSGSISVIVSITLWALTRMVH